VWIAHGPLHLRGPGEGEPEDPGIYNTRRFKKITTIIDGIDTKNVNIKELSQKLKTKFACGGTIKDGRIELQGDHREEVKRTF